MKTSSTNPPNLYRFDAYINPSTTLPEHLEVITEDDSTSAPGYKIRGTLDFVDGPRAEDNDWREQPHIACANLRVEDPQSVMAYMRRYGMPCNFGKTDHLYVKFEVSYNTIREAQEILRNAWKNTLPYDSEGEVRVSCVTELEAYVEENMQASVIVPAGVTHLQIENLWTLIAFLFLHDYAARKLGICANPDCPAPYFKKKRITQKFCEAGPCVAFAQRQYSLKWWNSEGKKRRELQRPTRQNKKKKKRT